MGRSPDVIVVGLHLGVALWLVTPFLYFMTAGAESRDPAVDRDSDGWKMRVASYGFRILRWLPRHNS